MHLQAGPDEGWGEPIPFSLTDILAEGVAVPRGLPRQGQRVRPDPGQDG